MKIEDDWSEATLEAAVELSPSVRSLHLRPANGVQPWAVGSHLRLRLPINGQTQLRHYSLVGLPAQSQQDGLYRIAVKRAEPGRGGSRHMLGLHVGERVQFAGPANHFALPVSAAHTLLVAGGIGITPIFGMALTLARRGGALRVLYAARADNELVFADELRQALGSRLQTFADARGERIDLDAEIAALPARAQLLICGPVPLLQAAQAAWARAGRARADMRFETFGSSGNRPVEPFVVRVPRHGLELRVPPERSLLDVLSENGMRTLSECERGECGLCALDVLALQGEIDHRDVFFSAAEQRENRRLCACVSRVVDGHGGGLLVLDSAFRPDDDSHASPA